MRTWVKFYTETNRDPKIGTLTWAQRGIWAALLALAGELDDQDEGQQTGMIGTSEDIAWRIRCDVGELTEAFAAFSLQEMIHACCEAGLLVWYITHFQSYLPDKRDRNVPEYRAWRRTVYGRDRFTCRVCGKPGPGLHAHHIKAWRDHVEVRYDIDNGITLCERCHREAHRRHHGNMA